MRITRSTSAPARSVASPHARSSSSARVRGRQKKCTTSVRVPLGAAALTGAMLAATRASTAPLACVQQGGSPLLLPRSVRQRSLSAAAARGFALEKRLLGIRKEFELRSGGRTRLRRNKALAEPHHNPAAAGAEDAEDETTRGVLREDAIVDEAGGGGPGAARGGARLLARVHHNTRVATTPSTHLGRCSLFFASLSLLMRVSLLVRVPC